MSDRFRRLPPLHGRPHLIGGLIVLALAAVAPASGVDPILAPLKKQVGSVPSVTGKVLDLAASPDGRRICLLLEKGTDRYSLVLYDLASRRMLAEEQFKEAFYSGELIWSPDSRYVCLRDLTQQPFVLTRGGQRRAVAPQADASDAIWRADRPGVLVYQAPTPESTGLYEHDIQTGKRRLLRKVTWLERELQLVRGKPCYVTTQHRGDTRGRWVHVRQVVDGREMWRLWLPRQRGPVYDPADWDGPSLSLSPDRRYFMVTGQASASSWDLLARVDEAGVVFNKPHHSIFYHAGRFSPHSVKWVQTGRKTEWAILKQARAVAAIVDPATGARYEDRFPSVKLLEFLPDGAQVGIYGPGLVWNEGITLDWYPERLLLSVRKPSTRQK